MQGIINVVINYWQNFKKSIFLSIIFTFIAIEMKKLRIYLDNCCFNRPYDDQNQEKIFLETEAKLKIQQKIKEGEIELIWSYMLDYENIENPNEIIQSAIFEWKKISICDIIETEKLVLVAEEIERNGIDTKDAIHIACALEGKADLFLTTDAGIIKKGNSISGIKIINPVSFFIDSE